MLANNNNAAWAANEISLHMLGGTGGLLALLGIVATPITSGDTAFRSARLILADILKSDQKKIWNRLYISIPLFIVASALTQMDFGPIRRYFAWSNQTLAMVVLWTVTAYLIYENKLYWGDVRFDYNIQTTDKEEKIDPGRLKISFGYIAHGDDAATILSSDLDVGGYKYLEGKQMVNSLDCKSCHSMDKESVGPSLLDIAERYSGKRNTLKYLSEKITEGGSGNWGDRAMTPHPALSPKEAGDMVKYIVSLGDKTVARPSMDTMLLREHMDKDDAGAYLLNATYRDHGANKIGELHRHDHVLLRNLTVQADDFDEGNVRIANVTTAFLKYIWDIDEAKYIKFKSIDLAHVKGLIYKVQPSGPGGTIKVHLDSKDGPVVSSIDVPKVKAGSKDIGWKEIEASLNVTQ